MELLIDVHYQLTGQNWSSTVWGQRFTGCIWCMKTIFQKFLPFKASGIKPWNLEFHKHL